LDGYVKADAAKRATIGTCKLLKMATEMFKELHIPAEKDILAAQLKCVCY
jgi:hypothetical protein